jgi:hypothetical protein
MYNIKFNVKVVNINKHHQGVIQYVMFVHYTFMLNFNKTLNNIREKEML